MKLPPKIQKIETKINVSHKIRKSRRMRNKIHLPVIRSKVKSKKYTHLEKNLFSERKNVWYISGRDGTTNGGEQVRRWIETAPASTTQKIKTTLNWRGRSRSVFPLPNALSARLFTQRNAPCDSVEHSHRPGYNITIQADDIINFSPSAKISHILSKAVVAESVPMDECRTLASEKVLELNAVRISTVIVKAVGFRRALWLHQRPLTDDRLYKITSTSLIYLQFCKSEKTLYWLKYSCISRRRWSELPD